MKFVDLFCGLGGASYGALEAGLEPVALIDSEAAFGELVTRNLRPHFKVSDLSVLQDDVIDLVCAADVMLCSPPCQSFSTLKSSNRSFVANDVDDAFLKNIAYLAAEARPANIMIENVPGFAKYSAAHQLRSALEALDYKTTFLVIDAADMGVPQRRRRAILIAGKSQPQLHFVKHKKTVRDAFDGLIDIDTTDLLHQCHRKHSDHVMRRIKAIPKNGGSRSALPKELQLVCHQRTNGYRDVYGRMSWDSIAPTITGGCTNPSKGRFLHPEDDRAISLREAARIQTLPDELCLAGISSIEAKAQMIGNAFPPLFASQLLYQSLN
jgi:DNA (cytosine-5)-methyltransferase 1